MGAIVSRLYKDGGKNHRYLLAASGACLIAVAGLAASKRRQARLQLEGETDRSSLNKRDVVYLITLPRIGVVPNVSPFVIKLETWFRMVGVAYEVVESNIPSSKKAHPYAFLNGEEIPDSNFVMERVSEHFKIQVDKNLTDTEMAVSVAFKRMLEENTFLTYVWYRYVYSPEHFWTLFTPKERLGPLGRKMTSRSKDLQKFVGQKVWMHGVGRHSPEEIYSIAETDLRAISLYLGDKDYLLGEKPNMIDCVLFGHLVQILLLKIHFPPEKFVLSQCNNLVRFVDRMKERFYPDWDQLCQPSG